MHKGFLMYTNKKYWYLTISETVLWDCNTYKDGILLLRFLAIAHHIFV